MTNSKNTKRALCASVLSVLLCVAMLLGSTWAWFTDSVTSGNNKIVAGNLDVELEYLNKDNQWKKVEKDTELFSALEADGETDNLWEPGHTEVVYLKVSNVGSLALKYQLAVNVANETAFENALGEKDCHLSDYLVFGKVESNTEIPKYETREDAWAAAGDTLGLSDYTKEAVLYPAEAADDPSEQYIALVVYMPTTVGNEANYRGEVIPSIDLVVSLVATQTPYEADSFNDQYDKDIMICTLAEFNALTEIPAGIKNVYVNINNTSLTGYSKCTTIGNYNISDQYIWVKDGETAPEGYIATDRKNAQNNATAYRTNKDGLTVHVLGSLTAENYDNGNFSGFQTLCFQLPEKSTVILENMTLSGSFNISGSYTYMYNLPDGSIGSASEGYTNVWYGFPFVIENIKLSNCTINGQWFANGDIAKNVEINGCTFNDYNNVGDSNWSNPIWWKNAGNTNVTVNNCKITSTRPMKVGEGGIGSVTVTQNTFTMLPGEKYTNDTEDSVKNTALCFGNKISGNVIVSGNTVDGDPTALISLLKTDMTMPEGKTFTVSNNTVADNAPNFVEWKKSDEIVPDFIQ